MVVKREIAQMTIFDDMQKVAKSLLGNAKFTQGSMVLVRNIPGAGSASDPGAAETRRYPVVSVPPRGAKYAYIMKNLAVASDLQMTFAPIEVEPLPRDFFEINGVPYKIMYIDRKPSAGTAVAFTLILRR